MTRPIPTQTAQRPGKSGQQSLHAYRQARVRKTNRFQASSSSPGLAQCPVDQVDQVIEKLQPHHSVRTLSSSAFQKLLAHKWTMQYTYVYFTELREALEAPNKSAGQKKVLSGL